MLSIRTWQLLTARAIPWPSVLSKRCPLIWQPSLNKHKFLWLSGPTRSAADHNSKRSDVRSLCHKWSELFRAASIPDPVDSAQLIIAHLFGKKMFHEVPKHVEVKEDMIERISTLCRQRLDRKPVQYIIGEWDFLDMTLIMKPPVLIPRPETEELCELIRTDLVLEGKEMEQLRFLDIGCGSGAISLYLLKQLPQASCVAIDKSIEACDLTLENANIHSLTGRISVLQADILKDADVKMLSPTGQFDMIVSNPPYIPTADMDTLMPEVHRYESHDALHGGADGLDIIRMILDISRNLLKSKGCVWLETDTTHPSVIKELVVGKPDLEMDYVGTLADFTKQPRFCKLQRK